MSRSNYNEDCDDRWGWIRWRGAVDSALRGKRGQAFLKEMLVALDALPKKELCSNDLESNGMVCALGAVGRLRGLDMSNMDPEDTELSASRFGISDAMVREIVFINDEMEGWNCEHRFWVVRNWVTSKIKP